MLTIVGGAYYENCLHPVWKQFYGSGLRAAAAITEMMRSQVELHTWIAAGEKRNLDLVAGSYGVTTWTYTRAVPVEFQYDYPISPPQIIPDPRLMPRAKTQRIEGDAVLVFGTLECEPEVKGHRLVYDPQAGPFAHSFTRTRHRADKLAIVLNLTEAEAFARDLRLGGVRDLRSVPSLARAIHKAENADVVIIKCGAAGAFVVAGRSQWVGCFATEHVFSIGSGDVFSAVFAAEWAVRRKDPITAAVNASAATGYYCQTQSLPIPASRARVASQVGRQLRPGFRGHRRKSVYLAGPLFTFPQQWLLNVVQSGLEGLGVSVFSPLQEVGLCRDTKDMRHVAQDDLAGIRKAAAMFALIDGADAGTMFEIGYARALGRPVIAFGEQQDAMHSQMMLLGSDCELHNDLATAIYRMAWHVNGQ